LYTAIPNAEARRIDAEHDAIVAAADHMADLIIESAHSVRARSLVRS
jgi:hypothetical protein